MACVVCSKIRRGFFAYERNTGLKHSLDIASTSPTKRKAGSTALTDDNASLWFGQISVGTPPRTYTGNATPSLQRRLWLICSLANHSRLRYGEQRFVSPGPGLHAELPRPYDLQPCHEQHRAGSREELQLGVRGRVNGIWEAILRHSLSRWFEGAFPAVA